MTYPISQPPAVRHGNNAAIPAARNFRLPDFVRKDPAQDGNKNANAGTPDAYPNAGMQIGGYNRLTHHSGISAAHHAHGPCQIPASQMPETPALASLRGNCGGLINSVVNMSHLDPQGRGTPFITHRGESAIIRHDGQGGAEIFVNGKPFFKFFNDSHYPGDTHLLMAGPDGRMHAGRDLPQEYLAEANSLVNSARRLVFGGGNVQRLMQRWGN